MREKDLIQIITSFEDRLRDQTNINTMLIDKLDLFSRTILMVLETQNRMIDIIPEWIERAEKGNPISDSELKDINKYRNLFQWVWDININKSKIHVVQCFLSIQNNPDKNPKLNSIDNVVGKFIKKPVDFQM